MAYTDFISLANAKAYLGVDDTSRDTEITRIITSAVVYVEQHSCHIWDEVNKTYQLNGKDCIKVYDYPITAVVKGLDKDGADVALVFETDYDQAVSQSYTIYTGIDSDAVSIILTVGYDALAEIGRAHV